MDGAGQAGPTPRVELLREAAEGLDRARDPGDACAIVTGLARRLAPGAEVRLGPVEPVGGGDAWRVPLHDRDRNLVGELRAPDAPGDPTDLATLEALAAMLSIALGRLRERGRHARHERMLDALVETGTALAAEQDVERLLVRIVEAATELVDARYGALGVVAEDGRTLERFVTVGIGPEQHERIGALPTGRGILGVLIDDPRPLRLADLMSDPRSVGFPEHHPPMHTFLGVPIITRTAVAGRLYLTEKRDGEPFDEQDEALALALASQAAVALENASALEIQRELAHTLGEASAHKSTFISHVSHELRSPLNTILGYAELLLEAGGLDDEQRGDVDTIRDAGRHLLGLVTDLLDLSRIEAGRMELDLSEVDAGAVVSSVIEAIRPQVAAGVDIALDVPEDLPPVVADERRLRQMLINLVGNAVRFTAEGSITVRCTVRGERVRIEVVDTGPGIEADDLARLFEPFFQAAAGSQDRSPRAKEGAGLGLAITRELAHAHGGSVSARSQPGSGTTMRIDLPLGGPATSTPKEQP